MTNHAVLIPNKVLAYKNDSLVRPVISASALDNGNIMVLNQKTGVTGEGEVFLATAPSSASTTRLWMAGEPEMPFATAGDNVYRGLGTIRDFYNTACAVFTGFALHEYDIITLTSEALDSTTTAAYAIPDDSGNYKWKWSAVTTTGLILRYLGTTYIPFASASAIGSGRLTAYQFEVYKA
jgi:hypothetical protein